MVRKKRVRHANDTSKALPSVETAGELASPLPNSSDARTGRLQRYKSWTPNPLTAPNPRNKQEITAWEEESMAWYRKHLGRRWCELYIAYTSEEDHLKDPLKYYDIYKEMTRIEGKKRTEHEREKKAVLGDEYIPNLFYPLDGSETDDGPASPPCDDIDNHGSRESCDTDRNLNKAEDSRERWLWTPEPEPYNTEKYKAWGQRHYGEDWYEQRETMLQERNWVADHDSVYRERQRTLRKIEREREQGKLPKKGKSWQELMAWARMHYGEAWYTQRQALGRDERERREALDPDEQKKKFLKSVKRAEILKQMRLERDEGMLAEGKMWHEIMAWPAAPSNIMPSVETGGEIVSSPSSSSEHSNGSGYSTYPPTPTDFHRQAMDGPQGSDGGGRWRWERLEWDAVQSRLSEARYEERKIEMTAAIRSSREDEECERRRDAEWHAVARLKSTDLDRYYIEKARRERRMRHLDLRLKGMTQEQIDAMDREEFAAGERAREEYNERLWKEPPTPWIQTQEEMEARHRAWDASGLSKERQAELVEMFGFPNIWSSSTDEGAESRVVSQPRASLPRQTKDVSRKTRGGRITKNAPVPAEALPPDRRRNPPKPDVLEELDNTRTAPQRRKRQRKTYLKERASRRLAGQLPEFGMLSGRGETSPLYGASLRQPSNTRKTSSPNPSSGRLWKKPTAVKGATPQGISKSKRDVAGRPKRSIKQLRA